MGYVRRCLVRFVFQILPCLPTITIKVCYKIITTKVYNDFTSIISYLMKPWRKINGIFIWQNDKDMVKLSCFFSPQYQTKYHFFLDIKPQALSSSLVYLLLNVILYNIISLLDRINNRSCWVWGFGQPWLHFVEFYILEN